MKKIASAAWRMTKRVWWFIYTPLIFTMITVNLFMTGWRFGQGTETPVTWVVLGCTLIVTLSAVSSAKLYQRDGRRVKE